MQADKILKEKKNVGIWIIVPYSCNMPLPAPTDGEISWPFPLRHRINNTMSLQMYEKLWNFKSFDWLFDHAWSHKCQMLWKQKCYMVLYVYKCFLVIYATTCFVHSRKHLPEKYTHNFHYLISTPFGIFYLKFYRYVRD